MTPARLDPDEDISLVNAEWEYLVLRWAFLDCIFECGDSPVQLVEGEAMAWKSPGSFLYVERPSEMLLRHAEG